MSMGVLEPRPITRLVYQCKQCGERRIYGAAAVGALPKGEENYEPVLMCQEEKVFRRHKLVGDVEGWVGKPCPLSARY